MFKQRAHLILASHKANKIQMEKAREGERIRMRTELRSLRRDRARILKRFKPMLDRQEVWQDQLVEDAREYKRELNLATCSQYRRQDKRDLAELDHWITDNDFYLSEIRETNRYIEILQKDIRETNQELERVNKRIAERKLECSKTRVPCHDKVMRRMENAVHSLGSQLTTNRQQIARIHHLCLKKALAMHIFGLLNAEVRALEKALKDHVDVARENYDQRDKTRRTIATLQEHYEKATASYYMDMNNMQFRIDKLQRLQRFFLKKNEPRKDENAEHKRWLRSQLTQSQKDNIEFRRVQEEVEASLKDKTIMEMVTTFRELVVENFALYLNITEKKDRIHEMIDRRVEMRVRISKAHGEVVKKGREAIARQKEMEEKRDFCSTTANELKEKIRRCDNIIQQYIDGFLKMLTELGFTPVEIRKMAGVYGKVEERNLPLFMGEVEKFVNKLAQIEDFVDYVEYEDDRRRLLPPPPPPENRQPRLHLLTRMSVRNPLYEEKEEEEDDDARPLSRQEVADQVMEELENSPPGPLPEPTMADAITQRIDSKSDSQTPTPRQIRTGSDVFG